MDLLLTLKRDLIIKANKKTPSKTAIIFGGCKLHYLTHYAEMRLFYGCLKYLIDTELSENYHLSVKEFFRKTSKSYQTTLQDLARAEMVLKQSKRLYSLASINNGYYIPENNEVLFKGNFNFYIDSNCEYDVLLFNKLTKQYYIKPKYFIQYDQFNNKYNEVVNISNFLIPFNYYSLCNNTFKFLLY